MSIILVFFEYTFYSGQDLGVLKNKISVEDIVPSYGNEDRDNDFGDDEVKTTGLFP
jgi:hypothetical protein